MAQIFKKTILLFMIFAIIFPVYDSALAAEPDYGAVPSACEVYYGEKVSFDITTASDASCVRAYLDGRYAGKARLVSSAERKSWTYEIALKTLGARRVNFRAYSANGRLLAVFPSPSVTVTVRHVPPVTENPIILDGDRAVLLGTPPKYCGARQRSFGFYFGTDPGKLSVAYKSNRIIRNRMNRLVVSLSPETTYYYQAFVVTSKGTFTGDVVSFTTPAKGGFTAQDVNIESVPQKYSLLFGSEERYYKYGKPPFGYATASEASKHMVKITVPVWKLSRGKKVPGTMSVTVNYKLENSVKAIFADIYGLDIKFPIASVKGYSYRAATGPGVTGKGAMSHHSFGAAIDINKKYNLFYRYKDKRNKKSPYYIPQSVIDIFEKYGWHWGGDFKEGYDTMHFQYLGLDLLG